MSTGPDRGLHMGISSVDNCKLIAYTMSTGDMKDSYQLLSGEEVGLGALNAEERRFLGELFADIKKGVSYLALENRFMERDSPLQRHARRLGAPLARTVLYRVCEDLATRLGVRQGYLTRDQVMVVREGQAEERKEMTSGKVAELAGCTRQAVIKAIRSGRLRARRVGKISLIWDKDAEAFARSWKGAATARKDHRLARKGGV
ncbi:MAG: hypothetical protein KGJ84_02155 [Elusimicrobia bacterium]|nr:hypothetical protein [Elusimicrobiota bacterium]